MVGPNGISCSSNNFSTGFGQSTCTFKIPTDGQTIQLTAAAAPGSSFFGWTICPGPGSVQVPDAVCTFTVPESSSGILVEPRFEADHVLTVSIAGSGAGTVTSSPAGVSCPGDCSHNTFGTIVLTLNASPAPGSLFAGWGGSCAGAGTNPECRLTLGTNGSVSATFDAVPRHAVAVSLQGSGRGMVTLSPGGACTSACSPTVTAGTTVTLTASPAPGSIFAGWGESCAGTSSCSLTVGAPMSVSASFVSTAVQARVVRVRSARKKRARLTRVTLEVAQVVSADVRVLRRGKTLAKKRLRAVQPGKRTVALRIPKDARAGRARVQVTFANEYGTELTRRLATVLPRVP